MYALCWFFAVLLASLSPSDWLLPAGFGCHGGSFLADLGVVFVPLSINLAGPAALLYLILQQLTRRGYCTALLGIKPTAILGVPVMYGITLLAYVVTASFGFTSLVSMSLLPLLGLLSLIGLWELIGIFRQCLKPGVRFVAVVNPSGWAKYGMWLAFVPTLLGVLILAAAAPGSFVSGQNILDHYEKRCPNLAADFKQSMQGQSWPPKLAPAGR